MGETSSVGQKIAAHKAKKLAGQAASEQSNKLTQTQEGEPPIKPSVGPEEERPGSTNQQAKDTSGNKANKEKTPKVSKKGEEKAPEKTPKPVAPKEEPKAETPKAETPKAETPKAETPKVELAKEEPKAEVPKEEPKAEEPKAEEPKAEEPKAEAPKEEPKAEAPKEEPKAEAPKEEPKKEEPKKPIAGGVNWQPGAASGALRSDEEMKASLKAKQDALSAKFAARKAAEAPKKEAPVATKEGIDTDKWNSKLLEAARKGAEADKAKKEAKPTGGVNISTNQQNMGMLRTAEETKADLQKKGDALRAKFEARKAAASKAEPKKEAPVTKARATEDRGFTSEEKAKLKARQASESFDTGGAAMEEGSKPSPEERRADLDRADELEAKAKKMEKAHSLKMQKEHGSVSIETAMRLKNSPEHKAVAKTVQDHKQEAQSLRDKHGATPKEVKARQKAKRNVKAAEPQK